MRPPRTARSAEVMTAVRQMSARGATPQEMAQQARTSQGHVVQAGRLLDGAPDLAAAVEQGQISLTNGYRLLVARTLRQKAASPATADVSGPHRTHWDVPGRSGPVRDRPAIST